MKNGDTIKSSLCSFITIIARLLFKLEELCSSNPSCLQIIYLNFKNYLSRVVFSEFLFATIFVISPNNFLIQICLEDIIDILWQKFVDYFYSQAYIL